MSSRRPATHLPGEAGIWVFIIGDLLVFTLFFATFLFYRGQAPELFNTPQGTMNQDLGAINTVLLLVSSWLVVCAINAARASLWQWCAKFFTGAWLCGAGFVVVKYFEWGEKIRAGHTMMSNDFFMYYFVFTGIHLLHLLIGLGVLAYLVTVARKSEHAASDISTLESGASFWHLVDLLWLVLFALLYLVK